MVEVDSFYRYLISNGYFFDKELIENYLLSLKVKPFVILTGNSGTGKTKLSQLFAEYLYEYGYHMIKVSTAARSWCRKKDLSKADKCGWSPSANYFFSILPINTIIGSYEIEFGEFKLDATIEFVPQLYYDKNNEQLKECFKKLYYKEQNEIKTNLGASNDKQLVDLGIDFKSMNSLITNDYIKKNDIIFNVKLNSFMNDRFLLPVEFFDFIPLNKLVPCNITAFGINSKAEFIPNFRMFKKLSGDMKDYLQNLKDSGEKKLLLKINNFNPKTYSTNISCFKYRIIPVGANWTDNSNIVGYYNLITKQYQSTPAYELIKQAQLDLNNPYFLILDEMNLSHVERYFADFLSAIESGEEIPLYGEDEALSLPDNLFIIGTVNVDETTYMFSPKVLDRANTLEFDTLSAFDYMLSDLDEDDFKGDIMYLQSPLRDNDVSKLNIQELKDKLSQINCQEGNLWEVLASEFTIFQNHLKESGFEFGFRVINEILRFMVVAWKYENSPPEWNRWERYFDAQIKQKILPKLHGSEKAIGNVLTNLFNICLVDRDNNQNPKNFFIEKKDCKYYTSAVKLQDMSKVLANQRYVSFIN